jgi:(p)ppGpp synthase/HD superfamily hydrolase
MIDYAAHINKAMNFAVFMHGSQMYGYFPYIVHLSDVVRNIYLYNYDNVEMIAAGFLHDTVEDCNVPIEMIEARFGEQTAKLVNAVSGVGANRKERKASMISKLQAYPKAIPLKMADRLSNIRNCVDFNPRMLDMYKKEFDDYDLLFESTDRTMNAEIRRLLNR